MSLFVGNISKHVKSIELEEDFNRFGRCEIKRHGSYAFIEYDSEKAAEEAMAQMNGVNMKGLEIGIEWSKRSSRYDPRESRRPPRRDSDAKCYNCNRIGHFARDCRSRRRSRSRSFERRPRRDSRSYSPRDRRRDRDYRRRSPDRRRRSPRRDSYERRDDRRYEDRHEHRRYEDRHDGSYERRDEWREDRHVRANEEHHRRRNSFSSNGQRSTEGRHAASGRSPRSERRRSGSPDSGYNKDKPSVADEAHDGGARMRSPAAER